MRSNVSTLMLAAASLAPSALLAQPLEPATGGATIVATAPGKGLAERVAQITASVEAVNSAKRTVTLKGLAGETVTLAVGPEVQNFDRIRVGDLVVVRYVDTLTLELRKRGTAMRERDERDVTDQALASERPAARDAHEVHVVADVIALDPLTQTVRLRPDASGGPPRRRPGAIQARRGRRPGRSHLRRGGRDLRSRPPRWTDHRSRNCHDNHSPLLSPDQPAVLLVDPQPGLS
jgi:hypothetical protein